MKAASPAFQFYPKDWLSDARVKAMTFEERGVYVELLSYYWLEGGLSSDPARLARLLGVAPRRFERLWRAIGPCFTVEGNALTQKRMESERSKQAAYRDSQARNGRKGGKPSHINNDSEPVGKPRVSDGATQTLPVSTFPSSVPRSLSQPAERTEERKAATVPASGPPVYPLPPDVRTEHAVRDAKNKAERRLLHVAAEVAEILDRDPPVVLRELTAYKNRDGELVGGKLDVAQLSFARLEKSIADGEAWLAELKANPPKAAPQPAVTA